MTKKMPSGKAKRGNGEGSVTELRKLSHGEAVYRWLIWATLPTGERKRLSGTHTGRGIQEARKVMQDAKREAEKGEPASVGTTLTMTALMQEWIADRQHAGVSARTQSLQADLIRLHILPRMGKWKVAALTPKLLVQFHRELLEETTLGRTRQQVHHLLRQALGYAVREGHLSHNPIREVKLPRRHEQREELAKAQIKAWTPEQAKVLIGAALAAGDPLSTSIAFALRTGMRRGEIFGLRWENVDLEAGSLKVQQVLATHGKLSRCITHPKTRTSRRTIQLGRSAREVLEHVRQLQERQGRPLSGYVFTTRKGEMQHPNNANRTLKRLLKKLKLPLLPYHSLRHTFVSVAAHQGVSPKALSVYIGHSDSVVTQQIYLHLWPEHQEAIEIEL